MLNDTNIFYTNFLNKECRIKNISTGDYDFFGNVHNTVKHPYWGDDYKSCFNGRSSTCDDKLKNRHCKLPEWYCFARDYSVLIKKNIPVFMRFEIAADSNIVPISFFGTYPENHPIDNYYNGGSLYYYNSHTSDILNFTQIDSDVVLCDSLGNKIKDVYFGSQKFKYAEYPKSDKNSVAAKSNFYDNNTTYKDVLAYDEYRNVYLRIDTAGLMNRLNWDLGNVIELKTKNKKVVSAKSCTSEEIYNMTKECKK